MKFNCDKDQVQIVDNDTDVVRVMKNITESGVSAKSNRFVTIVDVYLAIISHISIRHDSKKNSFSFCSCKKTHFTFSTRKISYKNTIIGKKNYRE